MVAPITKRDLLKTAVGLSALGAAGASVAGKTPGENTYIVGITPGLTHTETTIQEAERYASSIDKEIDLGSVRHLVVGEYEENDVETLRSMDAVEYVEQEQYYERVPPVSDAEAESHDGDYPWGIERLQANTLHEAGYTGEGADIVIADTGTDPTHPSLEGNVAGGKAFGDADCVEEERRFEGVDCNAPYDDDDRHGTHVAGSAAAVDREVEETSAFVDIDRIAGVASEANIRVASVFEWVKDDGDYIPRAPWSNTAAAIQWAADQNYDVVNASLGGTNASNAVEDAIQSAKAQGTVFVASAGNAGGENCDDDCVTYPAAYDEAIAVAATTGNDNVAGFSSRGPEVDIGAPGASIPSTVPPHLQENFDWLDGLYSSLSGTSMAAPHVAGLVALVKQHTDLDDPSEIRDLIESTAEDVDEDEIAIGNGLIDPTAALDVEFSPTVHTAEATDVGTATATLSGSLDDLAEAEEVEVGFEYGPAGEALDQSVVVETRSEPGSFSTTLTNLDDGVTYEFRATGRPEGIDTVGTGDEQTFTTVSLACQYTNEDGTVDTDGVRAAIDDWQSGEADIQALESTIDAWASGGPVTNC